MKINPNSHVYPYPFPCCIWDEVCKAYKPIKQYTREIKAFEKCFRRTCFLALPKIRRSRQKYQPKPINRFKRSIELVRPHPISTRLEQLAFVQLRKLLSIKAEYGYLFGRKHLQSLNLKIRKTILSLYTRLANVIPPKPREKQYIWTAEDWEYFKKRLKSLAAPKKHKIPEKIKRQRKPLESFKRTNELAKHRFRKVDEPNEWMYKEVMRTQKPSERTNKLAIPKTREDTHYKNPAKISRGALQYKISDRIKGLSQPHGKRTRDSDTKDNPFAIPMNALKYKATARITELAEPREYPKQEFADGKISPTALTYKATPRIVELAQPRKREP